MISGFLPYGRHHVDDEDVEAVVRVLRSQWLTSGPTVDAFEARLSAATGAVHAVACNSGTAALHLAALALDLGPGDVVAVPAITFVATANAARFVGAEVVFCDVDPATGLVTPQSVADALDRGGPQVKAMFPVHFGGQAVDMAGLAALCVSRGVHLVEDACHAIGTMTADGAIGGCHHSAMACFSFHPVKTIAMGEGGAILTNDDRFAARLRHLRSHGITRERAEFQSAGQAFDAAGQAHPWYYEMTELGFNFRASDINCALGLAQLEKLQGFVAKRRQLADIYDRLLAPLADRAVPLARVPGCDSAWHLQVVRIAFDRIGRSRDEVMRRLHERGIGSQVHYLPVYRQPYYARRQAYPSLPGAEAYYQSCLTLPLYPAMNAEDAKRVVDGLAAALGA